MGVCGLVVAYNIMGAFAFRAIEGEYGDSAPEETALQLREDAVKRLWNITARLNILEQTKWRQEVTRALEDFQGDVVPLVKARGYRGVMPSQAWSFSAALMYSLSVYTTIGWSHCTIDICIKLVSQEGVDKGRSDAVAASDGATFIGLNNEAAAICLNLILYFLSLISRQHRPLATLSGELEQ